MGGVPDAALDILYDVAAAEGKLSREGLDLLEARDIQGYLDWLAAAGLALPPAAFAQLEALSVCPFLTITFSGARRGKEARVQKEAGPGGLGAEPWAAIQAAYAAQGRSGGLGWEARRLLAAISEAELPPDVAMELEGGKVGAWETLVSDLGILISHSKLFKFRKMTKLMNYGSCPGLVIKEEHMDQAKELAAQTKLSPALLASLTRSYEAQGALASHCSESMRPMRVIRPGRGDDPGSDDSVRTLKPPARPPLQPGEGGPSGAVHRLAVQGGHQHPRRPDGPVGKKRPLWLGQRSPGLGQGK